MTPEGMNTASSFSKAAATSPSNLRRYELSLSDPKSPYASNSSIPSASHASPNDEGPRTDSPRGGTIEDPRPPRRQEGEESSPRSP
eukprot:CAMPEP_0113599642 /NCGR_PEP_ID=MMETSP0015_2-20120614/42261_1 /TAXON_ID=2838 /ORGANISM="Odontella" /LENGTH=85 /DNA_ID=CAMNT_0000507803 /DNA_START=16 /DNA_END=271 /DNA_ORIENTATION=+ /assembly_acc=CAM_ASM_000160